MKVTTIKINRDDLVWWNDCCKKYGKSSAEVFSILKCQVQAKKQQAFYQSLPMPSNYKKPLAGIRIVKDIGKYRITKKVYAQGRAHN